MPLITHRSRLTAIVAVAMLMLVSSSKASAGGAALSEVRASTAAFHDIAAAEAAGYGVFTDAAGIACIDNPAGAMGIHYVKGALVGDAAVSAATPEALVYEPQPNGRLRLVAVEYVVFQDAWDAVNDTPPSLFGEEFELISSTNRYGPPAFYELHVWLWKSNPSGMFEDWNPRVTCAA